MTDFNINTERRFCQEIIELLKNPDDPSMELKKIGLRADKEIAKLKRSMLLCSGSCHFPDSKEKLNQIKANAIEEARLSIIIHSYAREGTFLDGADWAFVEISKQLEKRVAELLNNKEGE